MTFPIHRFGNSVEIAAEKDHLAIRGAADLSKRENWPADASGSPGGWRTSVEIEQLLELGFAEECNGSVLITYDNFEAIQNEIPVNFISAWAAHSPFLLKIDRKSDLGRVDFEYRYSYLLAGRAVSVERLGLYVKRSGTEEVFLLDWQMYSLVQAMDAFNALPPEQKTPQESWLTFAKVKGCAAEVGAALDSTLRNNDVIVPSMLGLDMREDEDGALTFLPKCAELSDRDFHQVFERNAVAEKLYSIDRPGLGRVRIVLSDVQHEVLKRMKRVRRVKGDTKERLKHDPVQVFDGVADQIDLPYGERVIGIGDFRFASIPRRDSSDSEMANLWQNALLATQPPLGTADSVPEQAAEPNLEKAATPLTSASEDYPPEESNTDTTGSSSATVNGSLPPSSKKFLLIDTNEEHVRSGFASEAERAKQFAALAPFERPQALRQDRNLHPHQELGVRWLQTCSQIPGRKGVLLADDMGVGKTVQILTFLAWCIESGKFPDLSKAEPPFRPILIVAPLILLDTRTWEREMENFFSKEGVIFWPVVALHGDQLARLRRSDAEGPEVEIGKPILDLDQIQRNRVVITNYDTLKNYQHSFAYVKNGKPLWSCIVSDEAQEFKIPNTRLSHAMKALESDFHITCTGTPVENRLLDLWNLTDVFQRGLLGSSKDFVEKFERDKSDHNLTDLKKRLLFQQPHSFLLRRTKSDVANLPPKEIVPLPCAMSEEEIVLHQRLVSDLNVDGGHGFLVTLHRFAQLYQHPALLGENAEERAVGDLIAQSSKLRTVLEKLHEIRAKREKAIIFARHRSMQAILAKVLQDQFQIPVRIINGETKTKPSSFRSSGATTRSAILNEFRASPGFNILILSPFVAGIGLTIVEANHVFHYGRWWNPAVESQATDRAYRIGQEKKVFVYLPILQDPSGRIPKSFDQSLDSLMKGKQRVADDFLSPLPAEDQLSTELFADLVGTRSSRS